MASFGSVAVAAPLDGIFKSRPPLPMPGKDPRHKEPA